MSDKPEFAWVWVEEGDVPILEEVVESDRPDFEKTLRSELKGYGEFVVECRSEGREPAQTWPQVLEVLHTDAVKVRDRLNTFIGFLDDLEDNHPDLARGEA